MLPVRLLCGFPESGLAADIDGAHGARVQSLWKDVPVDGAAEDEDEEDADFTVDLDQMLADANVAAAQTQVRRLWRGVQSAT